MLTSTTLSLWKPAEHPPRHFWSTPSVQCRVLTLPGVFMLGLYWGFTGIMENKMETIGV